MILKTWRSTRRVAVLVLVGATVLVAPDGGDARGKPLPALAGDNTASAVGPSVRMVRLSESVEIVASQPNSWWISGETDGSYAGIVLEEAISDEGRQYISYVQLAPPTGCSADGSICEVVDFRPYHSRDIDPEELCTTCIVTLDPGTYFLYVLADPGRSATVRFRLPGLAGEGSFTATIPVEASLSYLAEYSETGTGHMVGQIPLHVSGPGMIIGGVWWNRIDCTPGCVVHLGYTKVCFKRPGEDEFDPLNQCGFPFTSNGCSLCGWDRRWLTEAGDWLYLYRLIPLMPPGDPPGAQMGVFGFSLTFAPR